MKIFEFLAFEHVYAGLRCASKTEAIEEMAGRAAVKLGLEGAYVAAELSKREALGSTGIGSGVAIPHARLADIRRPFGLLARLAAPVDFDSIDEQPVDLVFVILLPQDGAQVQLGPLASAARLLRSPKSVEKLRNAADARDLYSVAIE
jgi:PTS system nitrogen regulatory IIA component